MNHVFDNRCPKCGYPETFDGSSFKGLYTAGRVCDGCGYCEEPQPTAEDEPAEQVSVTEPAASAAADVTPTQPPPAPGVLLRLVPPLTKDATTEQQRANCRKILLETLQRIESGEVDELMLVTVNSKQAPSPYTLRWQFVDPIRMSGLLGFAQVKLSSPPFVTLT